MQTVYTVLTVAVIVYFLVYIVFIMCCKKPIKTLFLFTLCGILALIAVNLSTAYTGVSIPVNPYTVGVSAAGGIMGVVTLLIIKIIFSL